MVHEDLETTDLKDILDWINRTRFTHSLGPSLKELPKGYLGSSCSCPIARGLGEGNVIVDGTYWWHWEFSSVMMDLPEYVRSFITDFDCGEFPELAVPDNHLLPDVVVK